MNYREKKFLIASVLVALLFIVVAYSYKVGKEAEGTFENSNHSLIG